MTYHVACAYVFPWHWESYCSVNSRTRRCDRTRCSNRHSFAIVAPACLFRKSWCICLHDLNPQHSHIHQRVCFASNDVCAHAAEPHCHHQRCANAFVTPDSGGRAAARAGTVLSVNDFLFKAEIDNMNLFKLARCVRWPPFFNVVDLTWRDRTFGSVRNS